MTRFVSRLKGRTVPRSPHQRKNIEALLVRRRLMLWPKRAGTILKNDTDSGAIYVDVLSTRTTR